MMSKHQLILIIIAACFSAKHWIDSFPIKSNLILNIRLFPLHLAKNIFENFTAHLSLFELSRCETIMYFAIRIREKET